MITRQAEGTHRHCLSPLNLGLRLKLEKTGVEGGVIFLAMKCTDCAFGKTTICIIAVTFSNCSFVDSESPGG